MFGSLFVLATCAGPGAAQLMPGGPAFHDQSYNVFLKQGEGARGPLDDADAGHFLASGNPLPLPHALSPKHILDTLLDLPEAFHRLALSVAETAQENGEAKWRWVGAAGGCLCVVLCGVLPALFMPQQLGHVFQDPNCNRNHASARRNLNRALAFSVGSLLGDVFLHLLPESYATFKEDENVGLYIIAGMMFCLLLEKLLSTTEEDRRRVAAILNLMANVVDNASHGLAIGGSFLVSFKFGVLTTVAILLHEIPHEVSDFAILLRGDFTRWSAIKAQLATSSGAVVGAVLAVGCGVSESGGGAAWILPFTAGGFLNIALVQILPDLLEEENRKEATIQLFLILVGVGVMHAMNSFMVM